MEQDLEKQIRCEITKMNFSFLDLTIFYCKQVAARIAEQIICGGEERLKA